MMAAWPRIILLFDYKAIFIKFILCFLAFYSLLTSSAANVP